MDLRVRPVANELAQVLKIAVTVGQPLDPEVGDMVASATDRQLREAIERSGVREYAYREAGEAGEASRRWRKSRRYGRGQTGMSITDNWDMQRKRMTTAAHPAKIWQWIHEGFYFATSKLPDLAKMRLRQCFEVATRHHVELAERIISRCALTFSGARVGMVRLASLTARTLLSKQSAGSIEWIMTDNSLKYTDGKLQLVPRTAYDWCMPIGCQGRTRITPFGPNCPASAGSIPVDREHLVRDATDMQHGIELAVFSDQPIRDFSVMPGIFVEASPGQFTPDFDALSRAPSDEVLDYLATVQFAATPVEMADRLKLAWEAIVEEKDRDTVLMPIAFMPGKKFENSRLYLNFEPQYFGRLSFWNGQPEEVAELPVVQVL